MSFQQLFKRSAFAAHDPLITRVYASNMRAQRNGGDFGLKSPVNRPKMSRYIRLGKAISGWRSGEEEARFMAQWGDGSVPWTSKASRRLRPSASNNIFVKSEDEVKAPEADVLPNVDAMTDAQFNRYLEHVRAQRDELRAQIYPADGGAGPASSTPAAPEEATLPHAAARGLTAPAASAEFQVQQTAAELAENSSKRVQARPHALYGLQYSSAPAAGASLAGRAHPGRALDRVKSRTHGLRALEGTNTEWVVGLGGLTGTGASGVARVSDKASLSQFDYSRERPERGVAKFTVSDAVVEAPPKVLALGVAARRWLDYPRFSGARRASPLQSFKFDLRVAEDDADADAAGERIRPGSRQWVAREHARPLTTDAEGAMGVLGGPRASRPNAHNRRGAARNQSDTIDSLLARIAGTNK